jgi:hypothetical protein
LVPLTGAENDKLLRVEAPGCVIHITAGIHDISGRRIVTIEVTPQEPDPDGDVWILEGPAATRVVRLDR